MVVYKTDHGVVGDATDKFSIDSGASYSFVNMLVYFISIVSCVPVLVTTASKDKVVATKKGVIRFSTGEKNIELEAYYVPSFAISLISVSQLADATDFDLRFNKTSFRAVDKHGVAQVTGMRCLFDNIYYLCTPEMMKSLYDDEKTILRCNVVTSHTAYGSISGRVPRDKMEMWHRRLGHLSFEALKRLVITDACVFSGPKQDSLSNEDLKDEDGNYRQTRFEPTCEHCVLSKAARRSYPARAKDVVEPAVGEAFQIDFLQVKPTSGRSNNYADVFVDEKSRFKTVMCCKHRDTAAECVQKYCISSRAQHGSAPRRMHSDQAKEFVKSTRMKLVLDNMKIDQTACISNTPEQRGLVERVIGILCVIMRSVLIACNLPHTLWDFALTYAAYTANHIYIQKRHKKTYFEMWTNQKPNLSHLRPFGCKTWAIGPSHTSKEGCSASDAVCLCWLCGWKERLQFAFSGDGIFA